MYIPPFNITEKILHLVSEISEQVGWLNTQINSDSFFACYREQHAFAKAGNGYCRRETRAWSTRRNTRGEKCY